MAIERAKQLFGAEHANVQPHSGSQANFAVYFAFLKPGDTYPGHEPGARRPFDARQPGECIRLASMRCTATASARRPDSIDYEEVRRIAREVQPKMIVAGASAYSADY